MAIKVVDVKSQLVLGMREIGSYNKIREMIAKLFPYAASRGVKITGSPIFICHEIAGQAKISDRQGNADLEVAVPIGEKISIDEEGMEIGIICYTIPGGKFAKIIYKGSYENCGGAYKELFSWIKSKGYIIVGPTREVYLNDPSSVKDSELLTEIYAPVQKGRGDKKILKEVK